jgi:hypothetical protein
VVGVLELWMTNEGKHFLQEELQVNMPQLFILPSQHKQ